VFCPYTAEDCPFAILAILGGKCNNCLFKRGDDVMPVWKVVLASENQIFTEIIQTPLRINAINQIRKKAKNAKILSIERIK